MNSSRGIQSSTILLVAPTKTARSLTKANLLKTVAALLAFGFVFLTQSAAQTLTTLYQFDGAHGQQPMSAPIQFIDGDFYGTTRAGGTAIGPAPLYFECSYDDYNTLCGVIYKMTPGGTLSTIHEFALGESNGNDPQSGLTLGANLRLFGETLYGGSGVGDPCEMVECGTLFNISIGGVGIASNPLYTTHEFEFTDGAFPEGPVLQGTDGNFYGTTAGGVNTTGCKTGAPFSGCGTVFKTTSTGSLTSLYSFCSTSGCPDGSAPYGAMVQGTDGNLYGTTLYGGSGSYCTVTFGCGTVFKITTSGTLTTLYSFCSSSSCTDGASPHGGLIQGTDGYLYGTTSDGGANGDYGTVFRITTGGTLTTLYSFCGQSSCSDGWAPFGDVMQAIDGNFYGTTVDGGANGDYGTVFKITSGGTLTTLYSFCSAASCADGEFPYAGLTEGTSGVFYGTTRNGGTNSCNPGPGCGTAFSLSTGLSAFVSMVPTSGSVGTSVTILGNSLTGATNVQFNGTSATFTVVSASEIQATVPSGATTGTISVTTSSATLNSNVPFEVLP